MAACGDGATGTSGQAADPARVSSEDPWVDDGLANAGCDALAAESATAARTAELFAELFSVRAQMASLNAASEVVDNAAADHPQDGLRRALHDVVTRLHQVNYGLVLSYVDKFTSQASPDDRQDFEAAAALGLVQAINTYDPEKGGFGRWAYATIRREVLDAVHHAEHDSLSRLDFRVRPAILRARESLGGSLAVQGRQPSLDEIAAEAGTTVEQVTRVLGAPQLVSLSEDLDVDLLAGAAGPTSRDERALTGVALEALIHRGLAQLTDRELFVVVRHFGLDDAPAQTLTAIGEMLGLSRQAVRTDVDRALEKLKNLRSIRRRLGPEPS